jgi:hypothetical protein
MDSTVKGCASAASHLGYPDVAALILEESMGPERIAVLFKLSASEQAWRHAALIILAGGISRYRAAPLGWSGEVEQRLAREALARKHPKAFDFEHLLAELSAEAARLVKGGVKREPLRAVA